MDDLAPIQAASGPARPWVKRVLFVALALALVICSAELAGQIGFFAATGEWTWTPMTPDGPSPENAAAQPSAAPPKYRYMMLHPYLGFVGDPSQNDKTFLEIHDNRFAMNEYGLVDDKPPVERRGPKRVIVGVVGGSVACFFAQHGSEALRQRLQYDARFAGREIVLVNLAVPGHKQPQQLMSLAYLLALDGELDILLNIDGFNEVALYPAENQAAGIHPLFPRMWDQYIAQTPDAEIAQLNGQIAYLEAQRERAAEWVARSTLRYSGIVRLIVTARDRRLERTAYEASLAVLERQPKAHQAAATGPSFTMQDESALYAELADIWRRCSLQLAALCQANGIAYFHFLQPNQYVADSKLLSDEERRVAFVAEHPYRKGVVAGYPLLLDAGRHLADSGVHFCDLSQAFADHQESLYYDACCHFNHTGNEILADKIATEILAHFEPDEGSHSGSIQARQTPSPTAVTR